MKAPATRRAMKPAAEFDRQMMARALALARRGEGRVEPNPMVGCVLARHGRRIGEGYHRRFGGPHAEVEALRSCCVSPRGATVYVSLEPCCHHAKTPPCTDALIEAGVARVVAAMADPNPIVRGRGLRRLRRAGLTVEIGLLQREAAELLAPYTARIVLARPFLIAKWAQSLDGRLTRSPGNTRVRSGRSSDRSDDSRWISCEASRRLAHRLRARVDAILVGSGTVLADDPMLTARGVPLRRTAMRVVLDGRLRISEDCQLAVTAGDYPTLVLTTGERARSRRADRLRRRGVNVVACRARRGRPSLVDVLRRLAQRDVTNLLVEGGPTLLMSLLQARLVDEARVFVAPMLIGGAADPDLLSLCGGSPPIRTASAPVSAQRSGCDVYYRMRLT